MFVFFSSLIYRRRKIVFFFLQTPLTYQIKKKMRSKKQKKNENIFEKPMVNQFFNSFLFIPEDFRSNLILPYNYGTQSSHHTVTQLSCVFFFLFSKTKSTHGVNQIHLSSPWSVVVIWHSNTFACSAPVALRQFNAKSLPLFQSSVWWIQKKIIEWNFFRLHWRNERQNLRYEF